MRPFEYVSPKTEAQAFSLLGPSWGEAEILAGGTDLLALMKDDVIRPKRLVNIKSIEGFDNQGRAGFEGSPPGGGAAIGALATLGDLVESPKFRNLMKDYPAFVEAVGEAASPQIRSLATVGGNLCQRPRCWYFRNGFGLLPEDETGKNLVATGENRYHAILGNEGRAKFVSPSTIVPILIAYNAKIQIVGAKGHRELPLEKFYVIPKSDDEREHDLRPNEIISSLMLPSSGGVKAAHYEIRQKAAFDWPLAVAAVALKMDGDTVSAARVVLGYVAPVPWISPEAEQALVGKTLNEETAKSAAEAALKNATPLSHNGYKVQLAKVALKRAILKAGGTA
jgi:xanthine dehydrogenase YagS FAD-binding subunit